MLVITLEHHWWQTRACRGKGFNGANSQGRGEATIFISHYLFDMGTLTHTHTVSLTRQCHTAFNVLSSLLDVL